MKLPQAELVGMPRRFKAFHGNDSLDRFMATLEQAGPRGAYGPRIVGYHPSDKIPMRDIATTPPMRNVYCTRDHTRYLVIVRHKFTGHYVWEIDPKEIIPLSENADEGKMG